MRERPAALPELAEIQVVEDGVHLLLREGADHQAILRRGVEAGVRIDRFDLVEPRLHEIFVRHAGVPENGDYAQGVGSGVGRGAV